MASGIPPVLGLGIRKLGLQMPQYWCTLGSQRQVLSPYLEPFESVRSLCCCGPCQHPPQLPFKRPQILSNRDHKALNNGTLGVWVRDIGGASVRPRPRFPRAPGRFELPVRHGYHSPSFQEPSSQRVYEGSWESTGILLKGFEGLV